MSLTMKWNKCFCPIAVYKDESMLGYKSGKLIKMDRNGKLISVYRMSDSIANRIKENNRLFIRLFRRDIKTSCITENGEVYFFCNKDLYCYDDHRQILKKITTLDSSKSTPLNIVPALIDTEYVVLWGDYFSNENREKVNIWGLKHNGEACVAYQFPPYSVRHIHNIIADVKGNGYYIFAGDNDQMAGIYYTDSKFHHVEPIFIGKQIARAVQGFCVNDGIIYATDSVSEQNYLCILEKKDGWEHRILEKINGSCIYGTSLGNRFFFSTTVESPETDGQNRMKAMLSTARGSGILSDKVEVISVDKNYVVRKELEFIKDSLPYKLFQYGVVTFPASQSNKLLVYPIAVKKYDGKIGILEEKNG